MEIIVLIAIVVFIGALRGGNSFGDSARKGCGCVASTIFWMIVIIIIIIIILAIFASGG